MYVVPSRLTSHAGVPVYKYLRAAAWSLVAPQGGRGVDKCLLSLTTNH